MACSGWLDRQPQPDHAGQHRAVPSRGQRDPAGGDPAAAGVHRDRPVAGQLDPGDRAVLHEVHPERVGGAGVGPGHVVVLGDAAAPLQGGAGDRVPHAGVGVDDRAELPDLVRVEPLGVHAVEPVGVDPPPALPLVVRVVRQVQHAALAEQDVVVQLLGQALPQPQRVLVDRRALVPQVVGPDDRGVAGHVAAGQPAPLQHRDVGDAVVAGQVVRGGQAVPATADDDHVVVPLRHWVAPQETWVPGHHRQLLARRSKSLRKTRHRRLLRNTLRSDHGSLKGWPDRCCAGRRALRITRPPGTQGHVPRSCG